MLLSEYQWSRNPRGMHNFSAAARMDLGKLVQMHMGWAKLVTLGPDYLDLVEEMLKNGITPIVRVWRPRFGAGAPTSDLVGIWRAFFERGVRWFEFYNEPNLDNEWQEGHLPDWRDMEGTIIPILQNWLAFAEIIIGMGGYPAFPALSESVGIHYDVSRWLDVMMNYLAEQHYDRFRGIAQNGLWVATHPYIYNHFYQEGTNPLDARAAGAQRAWEPGWRFEYPYDPITQASKPGITSISGPADAPLGDPVGLVGMGYAFMKKFEMLFGGGAIPVVGTEGGINPVPKFPGEYHQLDTRFPGYSYESHGEATVAMFNWIAQSAPPWMFGVTLWKEDEYYVGDTGVTAVRRLSESPPIYKNVPPLEPFGGIDPRERLKGPGPIHGTPDLHFVILAPGFQGDWFFEQGRAYYERFRPILLPSVDYLAYIPYERSVGVTLLTPPGMSEFMKAQISERYPYIWIDLLPIDQPEQVGQILNARAASGRKFG
ncbi:MAG: hypothetical protein IAE83_18955 [Anaerolinea sp.]|nr:hypothetical protein [Anaerolinea sp.]MCC6972709.1 hypothetical protein [Anaerolineae bacterium]